MARRPLYAALVVLLAAAFSLGAVLRSSAAKQQQPAMTPPAATSAAETWRAGAKRAPDFHLRGESGKPLSLASLRGRPVLLAFLDPLCRDFCPLEAQQLSHAVRAATGTKPLVVAVSVNIAGDRPDVLRLDRRKWKVPQQWRWAVGDQRSLAHTWQAYGIGVMATTKTVAGVHTRSVTHTEASYLIDANGYERALFVWPYASDAVTKELRATAS